MKRWLVIGWVCAAVALGARAAEENFSKAVRAEDFSAAGLTKLTPAELARLDALVRDYQSGALMAAQREVEAETQAARAETTRAKEGFVGGLLAKAKVVLTPGTEVEYTSVDTQLPGDFRGWSPGTVFALANGQHWQVTDSSTYGTPPEPGPRKVRIVPGALGSFFLEIEGVRQKPRVTFVGGGK